MTSEEKLDLSEVIRQAGVKLLRIAGSCEHSEADGYLLRRIGDSLCQARESLAKVDARPRAAEARRDPIGGTKMGDDE